MVSEKAFRCGAWVIRKPDACFTVFSNLEKHFFGMFKNPGFYVLTLVAFNHHPQHIMK
jgi:hypothetical protein